MLAIYTVEMNVPQRCAGDTAHNRLLNRHFRLLNRHFPLNRARAGRSLLQIIVALWGMTMLCSGCAREFFTATQKPASVRLSLESADFVSGKELPEKFVGCHQIANSPALHWSHSPTSTASFAVTMIDPDASPAPFVHWVVVNIDPHTHNLPSAIGKEKTAGGVYGTQIQIHKQQPAQYISPCPPPGEAVHHYVFTLYAEDIATIPASVLSQKPEAIITFIQVHSLATAKIYGTYHRSKS